MGSQRVFHFSRVLSIDEILLTLGMRYSELNILSCYMGQIAGDKVNVSLDLMQHSIRVGHAAPVLHAGASRFLPTTVNFFLNFSWQDRNQNLGQVIKTFFIFNYGYIENLLSQKDIIEKNF